jgi:hypothetical protein
MGFSSSTPAFEVSNWVAALWLDRPGRLSAIATEMWGNVIRFRR